MVPRVPRGSSIQVYTHAHLLAREYYMLIWRDGKAHHVFKDANWSFGRPFNNTVPPSERNIRLRSGDVLQHTCVYNSSTARPSENRGFAMPLKRTTETGRCIPWRRVVATPRVPPGYSAEGSRGGGGGGARRARCGAGTRTATTRYGPNTDDEMCLAYFDYSVPRNASDLVRTQGAIWTGPLAPGVDVSTAVGPTPPA